MSFLARLVSGNFRSLEKLELGALLPQPPLRKISARSMTYVHSYLRVRFDIPSSINCLLLLSSESQSVSQAAAFDGDPPQY